MTARAGTTGACRAVRAYCALACSREGSERRSVFPKTGDQCLSLFVYMSVGTDLFPSHVVWPDVTAIERGRVPFVLNGQAVASSSRLDKLAPLFVSSAGQVDVAMACMPEWVDVIELDPERHVVAASSLGGD